MFLQVVLSLDVGGTGIKTTLVSTTGELLKPIEQFEAKSNQDREIILNHFSDIINSQLLFAKEKGYEVIRAGVGFPGPFDYENGICKLKGIGKYDAIYDVNIKDYFENKFHFPFRFANDADLYTLGVCNLAEGKEFNRVMCVCIGTGIGSGFFARPNLVKTGDEVPTDGFIYHIPYQDGIVDQYLSATGLRTMIKKSNLCNRISDVKELADLSRDGNKEAKEIFSTFANQLAEVLPNLAQKFHADCLVVGGQIAKSADLFITPLENALKQKQIRLRISTKSSELALRAACLL